MKLQVGRNGQIRHSGRDDLHSFGDGQCQIELCWSLDGHVYVLGGYDHAPGVERQNREHVRPGSRFQLGAHAQRHPAPGPLSKYNSGKFMINYIFKFKNQLFSFTKNQTKIIFF